MPRAAPRYDPRILEAAREIDDGLLPIAEICRRVGRAASALGVPRPSYVHLRRLVQDERARRRELRELRDDVVESIVRRSPLDAALVADRLRDIGARHGPGARS